MDSSRAFVAPTEIVIGGTTVILRTAMIEDVPQIVALLAADDLGAVRDGLTDEADLVPYVRAFEAIDRDPAHTLLVGQHDEKIVATMQLTVLPGLARRGAQRAQIEAVRVDERFRGVGLGTQLFAWAIDAARSRGCALVQLTSDKSRVDAHRFYEHLGFTASHEGYKLLL